MLSLLYASTEERTGCYLCIGYEPGCSLDGTSSNGTANGDTINVQISLIHKTVDKLAKKVHKTVDKLAKKVRRQKGYIDDIRSDINKLEKKMKRKNETLI